MPANKKSTVKNKAKGAKSAAKTAAAKKPAAKASPSKAAQKPIPTVQVKKQAPPTAPQLTKLPPPKLVYVMPKSIVGEPPPPPKRSKGAPPPVIAKPKMKPKPVRASDRPKEPKKKIDFANAISVSAAAVQAVAVQKSATGFVIINGRRVRVMSTKGIKVAKKKALTKAEKAAAVAAAEESVVRIIKPGSTKMSERELERYHEMLLKARTELVGRVEITEKEALKSNDGNLSTMPLHMADIGTDTFEQSFALEFAQQDRVLVREVDDALGRIKDRTFGLCMQTGKPIPKGRLDAKPWARFTIEAERVEERSRGRV